MALDLKKSFASVVLEKPIATGYSIAKEGMLLCRVVEGGVEKVRPCAAAGSEVVVGFSMANNEQPATAPVIESVTAPVILTTGTLQLAHTNLVTRVGAPTFTEMRILDSVTGVDISTQIAAGGTPANTNEWCVDPVTGIVTLHSGRSTHALTVFYRYNLTVVQSQQLFFQPNVNNTAINVLGLVGIYTGKGQIFTLEYDMEKDYSVSLPVIHTGTAGSITISGGTALASLMRVIKAPTAGDLSLGLEFNI